MLIDAHGWNGLTRQEAGLWYSLRCLGLSKVLIEAKNGANKPLDEDEMMDVTRK